MSAEDIIKLCVVAWVALTVLAIFGRGVGAILEEDGSLPFYIFWPLFAIVIPIGFVWLVIESAKRGLKIIHGMRKPL